MVIKKCYECGGKIKLVKKKVVFNTVNPGKVVLETEFYECQNCGEIFFDERQSLVTAKEIDKILEEKNKKKFIFKIPKRAILI